jgi:hypothetical protein
MDATRKDYNLEKSGINEQITLVYGNCHLRIGVAEKFTSLLKRYKRLKQLTQSYTEN